MIKTILVCVLVFGLCASREPVFAATATLMPLPEQQFFDNSGLPLAGGLLYTCQPGTTCGPGGVTPKATYANSYGVTQNTNPVVLDSAGRASIWIIGLYKVALYDALGNMIYTQDNVSSGGSGGGGGSGITPLFYDTTSLSVTKDLTGLSEVIII